MWMYLVFVLAVAFLGWFALRAPKTRILATAIVVALAVSGPMVYFDMLSRPKLLGDEMRAIEDVIVKSFEARPGEAIYYWLIIPDIPEPRYYYEGWTDESRKRAAKLQEAFEKSENPLDGVLAKNLFEDSIETEKPFTAHPLPQPKRIPKEAPPPKKEYDI